MNATTQLDIMRVDTYDRFSFGIADISQYQDGLVITNPTIEITPPGYPKVALSFSDGAVNIFRSADLQLECDNSTELPDGIYTVTYSITPATTYFITRSFLRVDGINCKLQKLFLSLDLECRCPAEYIRGAKRNISTIKLLIEGAIAAANDSDPVNSYMLYRKADDMLDTLKKCNHNCYNVNI